MKTAHCRFSPQNFRSSKAVSSYWTSCLSPSVRSYRCSPTKPSIAVRCRKHMTWADCLVDTLVVHIQSTDFSLVASIESICISGMRQLCIGLPHILSSQPSIRRCQSCWPVPQFQASELDKGIIMRHLHFIFNSIQYGQIMLLDFVDLVIIIPLWVTWPDCQVFMHRLCHSALIEINLASGDIVFTAGCLLQMPLLEWLDQLPALALTVDNASLQLQATKQSRCSSLSMGIYSCYPRKWKHSCTTLDRILLRWVDDFCIVW